MIQIYIWQLPISNKRCFRPVNYTEVDLRDYVNVYYKDVNEVVNINNCKQFLEELYGSFQVSDEMPIDYHARSVSVSDLILLRDTDNNKVEGYIVDLTGFNKVKVNGLI